MILPVKYYGDPVLRQKAQEIKIINDEIKELSNNLMETMQAENGLGLAAPQVGISLQAIAIDTSEERDNPYVLLNPEITYSSKEMATMEEGCLSFPDIYGKIMRHEEITVEGLKIDGQYVKLHLKGIESRAIQHEFDHLQGVLFIDKMSASHKIVLKGKLKKLKKATQANLTN